MSHQEFVFIRRFLSKPLIVGYNCPDFEDCECQQFVKASQPLNLRKVSRTLLQSNVLWRLHNSNLYYSLLSIPLPYSFFQIPCMNKRFIVSVQWSYPLDGRNKFWASSTTVHNHFQQPKSALGHKSVETCTFSGRLWPQKEKQRVTKAAETAKGI